MLSATNKLYFRVDSFLRALRTQLAPLSPPPSLSLAGVFSPKKCRQLKHACIFFASLATLQWVGCKQTSSEAIPAGAYAYTSYDSGGVVLVRGWLSINISDSTAISGEWHFKPNGSLQRIGPQTGDGKLVGGISRGQVWIELNPQVRNNNLQLNGTLALGQFAGQWTWISFSGIANQGTFKAIRK